MVLAQSTSKLCSDFLGLCHLCCKSRSAVPVQARAGMYLLKRLLDQELRAKGIILSLYDKTDSTATPMPSRISCRWETWSSEHKTECFFGGDKVTSDTEDDDGGGSDDDDGYY